MTVLSTLCTFLSYTSYVLTCLTLLKIAHQCIIPQLQYIKRSKDKNIDKSWWRNKVVLITGATSGIGEHMAMKLAMHRAKLIITGRNTQKLSEMKSDLGGAVLMAIEADLTNRAGVEKLCQQVLKECKQIDVLVLNAGRSTIKQFSDYSLEELDTDGRDIMELNFFSPVFICRMLEPLLNKGQGPTGHGGHVLVTSSVAGRVGVYNRTMYCASKSAVNGFFEALRREWEGRISVSVACPGFVKTPIHFNALGAKEGTVERDLSKFITPECCVEHMMLMVEKNVPFRTIPLSKEFILGFPSWLMPDALKTWFIKKENVVKVKKEH